MLGNLGKVYFVILRMYRASVVFLIGFALVRTVLNLIAKSVEVSGFDVMFYWIPAALIAFISVTAIKVLWKHRDQFWVVPNHMKKWGPSS